MTETPLLLFQEKSVVCRFPQIRSIETLYNLHIFIVAEKSDNRRLVRIDPGNIINIMKNESREEGRRYQSCGIYFVDETTKTYRPTTKGAFLLTAYFLPPFNQIISWFQLRESRRLYKIFQKQQKK